MERAEKQMFQLHQNELMETSELTKRIRKECAELQNLSERLKARCVEISKVWIPDWIFVHRLAKFRKHRNFLKDIEKDLMQTSERTKENYSIVSENQKITNLKVRIVPLKLSLREVLKKVRVFSHCAARRVLRL